MEFTALHSFQMFLTVYLSDNEQHFTEVPVTPETMCRDVVDLCKEPGESECHLAEVWCGSERPVADNERMFDVLQRFGSQRSEVRFFLRHERPPGRDTVSGPRSQDPSLKRNGVKVPGEHRRKENGVHSPRMDLTLAELQEMASRQQQQIEAQQQMLATKVRSCKDGTGPSVGACVELSPCHPVKPVTSRYRLILSPHRLPALWRFLLFTTAFCRNPYIIPVAQDLLTPGSDHS
ncbi:apoptosis-stimulating of p53 protein 2-like isoform X2 [Leptonychotes weddellii]|uniref:Apoptosis-stimulating of p53 protein 2-like isoform X2 n=1 Tax=Leptonychotes weddellii TaxID=9713 RepID=A0A7F8PWI8_LEPWE|nr:apoptosis-stimulating of p53 protein 2-like isoform X2 [Leptonychotes weddellii]